MLRPQIVPVVSLVPALVLASLVLPATSRAACDCTPGSFRVVRSAKLGLESQVLQSTFVNDERGKLKVGARAFMPASTNLSANQVFVGAEASIGSVNANLIRFHPLATVAGPVVGPLALPIQPPPLCSLPPFSCGTESVKALAEEGVVELTPGDYGTIKIGKAAFVRLLPGVYNVCNLSIARGGALVNEGPVTMNVVGIVRAATESLILPDSGQPRIAMNVAGVKLVFGRTSVVRAEVVAPEARFKIGAQGSFDGCFCTRDVKIGAQALANCIPTASPSGAFVD